MKAEPKFDKLMVVNNLNEGDKVKLINGEIAEYVRLKQKNFVGLIDGKSYNIPVNMFLEVVEKVDLKEKMDEQKKEYTTMKKGELFYINHKGNAMLFQFDSLKNGKIVGINPSSKSTSRIDPALFGGKVSNLKS